MAGLVEGKSALVTGGASGIGRSTALVFAHEGARVLVCDVDDANGEAVAKEITGTGGEARFLHVDVTREADVESMCSEASTAP